MDKSSENLPSATANDSSKRGRKVTPASENATTRTRKPSFAMQEKKKEEVEQIERLAEAVGEKVDEILVDVRTSNERHLNEDQGHVEEEAARMVLETSKVEKMYDRYQQMWKDYCDFHELTNERDDQMLKGFFMELSKKYAASTLWVIYSCVNAYFIEKYGTKLNTMPRLSKFLKQVTQHHVCRKSKVFTKDQVHRVLMYAQESGNPEDTLMGVGVALMYYGLLRSVDVLNVEVSDVEVVKGKTVYISFEHKRKRRNPGFAFHIPLIYSPVFHRYTSELNPYAKKDSRYLKNFNDKTRIRTQNAGRGAVSRWISRMCDILGVSKTGYTTHAFRRSAATNLADSGVSFVNLKRHGQWSSDSVVEGYIANSLPLRLERERNLLPEDVFRNDVAEQMDIPSQQDKKQRFSPEDEAMIMRNIPEIKEYLKERKEKGENKSEMQYNTDIATIQDYKKKVKEAEEATKVAKLTFSRTPPAEKAGVENLPLGTSDSEDDVPISNLRKMKSSKHATTKNKNNVSFQDLIQEEYELMMEQEAERMMTQEESNQKKSGDGQDSDGTNITSQETDSGRSSNDTILVNPDNANSFWSNWMQDKTIWYKCNINFSNKE